MRKETKILLRMAMITSPILAIYNIAPMSLLLSSDFITINTARPLSNPFRLLMPVGIITLNALIIWLINIWLVSKYQSRVLKSWGNTRYILSYIMVLAFVLILQYTMSGIRPGPPSMGNLKYYPFIGSFANNTIILIILELMITRNRKAKLELEKKNLELLNQKSRFDHLKQQIKPHFLFNALNTLKLLVKNRSKDAEDFVVNLSNFLRSSLTDHKNEKILVKKDFEIFKDFMLMQQVRFENALIYQHEIPSEILESKYLPVFTLQILAENAIKHNEMSKKSPLKITIDYFEDHLVFRNNLNPKRNEEESTGIGLSNLSERFKILSGSDITIEKSEGYFQVSLRVI